MDKQEILKLIDNRARELEREAYKLGELENCPEMELEIVKAEANALRQIQIEIRKNG